MDISCSGFLKNRRAVFILFLLAMLLKTFVFQYLLFSHFPLNIFAHPSYIAYYWCSHLCLPLFIASFVLISCRKTWTIILLLILDLWAVSNLMYYGANELPLSIREVMMATNLKGFEGSLTHLFKWVYVVFPVITLSYFMCVNRIDMDGCRSDRRWFAGSIVASAVLFIILSECHYRDICKVDDMACGNRRTFYLPFYPNRFENGVWDGAYMSRLKDRGFISYLPTSIVGYAFPTIPGKCMVEFTDEERLLMNQILSERSEAAFRPCRNLVIIIVESLESWALDYRDAKGNYVMPFMHALSHSDGVMYVPRITSQVRHGVSGDGQMIVNTGLLPLNDGAACMLYGDNVYPNIASSFSSSLFLNPCEATVWNQRVVAMSYGYERCESSLSSRWLSDKQMFELLGKTVESRKSCKVPWIVAMLTVSSHMPYKGVPVNGKLSFAIDTPSYLKDYLNAMNYLDKSASGFFDSHSDINDDTVYVITGDHTAFKSDRLNEILPHLHRNCGQTVSLDDGNYVPLIVRSSAIESNRMVDQIAYQADIFPTIMSMIGGDGYFWRGFGRNLCKEGTLPQFPEAAYALSEKLIVSDYFSTIR